MRLRTELHGSLHTSHLGCDRCNHAADTIAQRLGRLAACRRDLLPRGAVRVLSLLPRVSKIVTRRGTVGPHGFEEFANL